MQSTVQDKGDIISMEEKVYKQLGVSGALSIAFGVISIVAGIAMGVLLIVSGGKLLSSRRHIVF